VVAPQPKYQGGGQHRPTTAGGCGLARARSLGLAAFGFAKFLSPFPKRLKVSRTRRYGLFSTAETAGQKDDEDYQQNEANAAAAVNRAAIVKTAAAEQKQ